MPPTPPFTPNVDAGPLIVTLGLIGIGLLMGLVAYLQDRKERHMRK